MADVINLGQFPARGPSPLSGLSEAIGRGISLGTDIREARAREKALEATVAKTKAGRADENRKNAIEAIEQLSLRMNDMSPQEQEMFKGSEHYKQIAQSLVKPYAPEFYDKTTGEIMLFTNKDMYKKQIDKMKVEIIDTIMTKGVGGLTENQRAISDVLDTAGTDPVAEVLDILNKSNPMFSMLASSESPEDRARAGEMFKRQLEMYIKSGGRTGVRGRPPVEEEVPPEPRDLGPASWEETGLAPRVQAAFTPGPAGLEEELGPLRPGGIISPPGSKYTEAFRREREGRTEADKWLKRRGFIK